MTSPGSNDERIFERIYEIEWKGVTIVYLDFSNFVNAEEALAAIDDAGRFIARYPEGSVRTLSDVTGSFVSDELTAAIIHLTEADRPYVRAAAVVGLTGAKLDRHESITGVVGRPFSVFDSMQEAKDWLASK